MHPKLPTPRDRIAAAAGMAGAPAPEVSNARARWELENDVEAAGVADLDRFYRWDAEEQRAIQAERPWTKDPHYFKRCRCG